MDQAQIAQDQMQTNEEGAIRPQTSRMRRPRTAARRKPDTSRPDTTLSSVGEIPDQTFFPDHDEEQDYDEGAGYISEADEDDDVFAFERPKTAAVPAISGRSSSTLEQDDESRRTISPTRPLPILQQPTRISKSAVPTTANTEPSVRFGFSWNDAQDQPIDSQRQAIPNDFPAESAVVAELGYHNDDQYTHHLRRHQNPNASSYDHTSPDPQGQQRPSVISSTLIGRPSTADTNNRPKPSLFSNISLDETSETTSSFLADDISKKGGIKLSEFEAQDGSRGIWNISELGGTATVPDGMTMRGDGEGGLHPKWVAQDGDYDAPMEDIEEDSPYAEIRVSVSNIDDPDMPSLTIRSLLIGVLFSAFGATINTFFRFRNPAPVIPPFTAQLLAYPAGKFLAWALPIYAFHLPKWLGGWEIDLNPGPFNIKEHTIAVLMANVSYGTTTGLHVATAADIYLGQHFSDSFTVLLTLAAQMGGFGIAGISRRLLVWPASMIWPYNLIITTNLNTFHAEDEGTGGMTRFKFFMIALAGAFAYYFFPGFIMTCLSYFSWICWMKPDNVVVNQLFGVSSGFGMGILTFDWAQIAYVGNPLNVPWWAQVNGGIAFLIIYWIIAPILYYTNVWHTSYLPVNTSQPFDRFGLPYNTSRIISADHKLDQAAYEAYSPIYISVSFALTFTVAFALTTTAIAHTLLQHGEFMYKTFKHGKGEEDDIHMKLMRQYPEVPNWWFGSIMVVTFIFAVIAVEVNDTGFPVYALILAILIPLVYFIPAGFLYATASQSLAINLIAELIPGYMLKGSVLGNMVAKSYATQTLYGAVQFTQDMKLGHYMKIPPRYTFTVQILATSISCLVGYAIKRMLFAVVPDMCRPTQKNLLTCPYTSTYYNSGILWGAIGPARLFSHGSLYWPQTFAMIAGVLLPIPIWWYGRKYPKSVLRQTNLLVMLNGVLSIPPATGVNYASYFFVGFIFQYLIRRRNFAWWSRYNYVLAGALDIGTLLSGIFIFLTLGLPGASLNWGGNTIYQKTADWMYLPFRTPPAEGFGPSSGWK